LRSTASGDRSTTSPVSPHRAASGAADKTIAEVRAAARRQCESTAAFDAALHAARFIGWRERTKSTGVARVERSTRVFHELSRRATEGGELDDPATSTC